MAATGPISESLVTGDGNGDSRNSGYLNGVVVSNNVQF